MYLKKLLLLTAISTAISSMANAATCSLNPVTNYGFSGAGGPTLLSCTIAAGAGQFLTNITVNGLADISNPSSNADIRMSVTGLAIGTSTGTSNGTLIALTSPLLLSSTSGQRISWGGLQNNTNTSLTSVRLDFTIQSVIFGGTANNVSFDLNSLTGTSGNTNSGCAAGTQLTGTIGCNAGAFVSGIFATTAAQPDSRIPEPATFGLVGGSLIALGFLSRRRK